MDEQTESLTLTDAERLLSTESSRLNRAEQAVTDARRQFDSLVTNHPMAQGDEGEGVLVELTKLHLPALEQAESKAYDIAETVHANARAIAEQTGRAEYALTDDELRAAGARQTFIREDTESLPYGRLLDAARFAILKDDRASLFCYARYIPMRLEQDSRTGPTWSSDTSGSDRDDLKRLLRVIDDKLKDQSLKPVNTRASDLMVRAGAVRRSVTKKRPSETKYRFETGNEVAWN